MYEPFYQTSSVTHTVDNSTFPVRELVDERCNISRSTRHGKRRQIAIFVFEILRTRIDLGQINRIARRRARSSSLSLHAVQTCGAARATMVHCVNVSFPFAFLMHLGQELFHCLNEIKGRP